MKYIATRGGVEKLTEMIPSQGQQELGSKLLHDFLCRGAVRGKYEDYRKAPTLGTASAFITMALDAEPP